MFCSLGFFVAASSSIHAENTPRELRILIGRVSERSGKDFSFEGQALMDAQGKPVRNDNVVCRRELAIASPLLSSEIASDSGVRWRCRAAPHTWSVKGSLRFTDRSGFFKIGKTWYRGALELVERDNALWIVNAVDVEAYLAGLLHGEMPRDFEAEALKAQAIAARSYAVATALERRASGAIYDLTDNTRDQMYPGAQTESKKGDLAVLATAGEYLSIGRKILKSFYHAASGGHSELPSNVWAAARARSEHEAFATQPNPWDKGDYAWSMSLSPEIFARFPELGEIVDVRVSKRSEGFRVQQLRLIGTQSEKELTVRELERIFGPAWIKSRKFEIVKEGRTWKILGEGWGHGVGLSQVAANKMAKAGKSYRQILEFHYPKAVITKLKDAGAGKLLAGPNAR